MGIANIAGVRSPRNDCLSSARIFLVRLHPSWRGTDVRSDLRARSFFKAHASPLSHPSLSCSSTPRKRRF